MIALRKGEITNIWISVTERSGGTVTLTSQTFQVFDMDETSIQASATASTSGNGTATCYIYGLVDTSAAGFTEGSRYQVVFTYVIDSETYISKVDIEIIEDDTGVIVPYADVMEFTGQSDSANLYAEYKAMSDAVIKSLDWNPTQIAHVNKLYDGTGSEYLYLEEMYISALARVANVREDAIMIKNTSTDATNAYFKVVYSSNAPANLTLVVEGGANDGSNSLAFSTYTTITTLISAINALGSGWSAQVSNSNYNSYKTTNLLEQYNSFVGSWAGNTPGWEYVYMADEPIQAKLYNEEGVLWSPSGFPYGHRNIAVSYTSGWSIGNMKNDIKMAVLKLVKLLDQARDQETFNIKSFSLGHLSITYGNVEQAIPADIAGALELYKLRNVR